MPTLDWIGKDKVINHHMDVPYRVLDPQYTYGEDTGNMIIHGDNLEALKSLLPQYEGRIRCIYIDPPYNTGNENWVYNDNVNDPQIRKWLPVIVYNRTSRKSVIMDAIQLRNTLEQQAIAEEQTGGQYIRPIVLFQAQPNTSTDSETFEKVKQMLMEYDIPEEQIAIKTSKIDDLGKTDLMSRDCPIRYIITVNALKEGWDCPFAYILASLANKTSKVDVEQILGRILRQPYASKHEYKLLNMSFVLTSSNDFRDTLNNIVKGLNSAGFSSKDYRIGEEELPTVDTTEDTPAEQPTIPFAPPASEESVQSEVDDFSDIAPTDTDKQTLTFSPTTTTSAPPEIAAMISHAEKQSEVYEEEATQSESSGFIGGELGNMMKQYHIQQQYAEQVKTIRIPQFFIQSTQCVFFGDTVKLEKEALLEGFTLSGQDAEVNFTLSAGEMYEFDVAEQGDAVPKYKRASQLQSDYLREMLARMAPEEKIASCVHNICHIINKNNAFAASDIEAYVHRVVANMTEDELSVIETSFQTYALRIKDKIEKLQDAYREKKFYKWLDSGKICCQEEYAFPEIITPSDATSAIPLSLYESECDDLNDDEAKLRDVFASTDSVEWWHRVIERKGFRINAFINHYPDFIVKMKSGRILVVEFKGDHLGNDNSESKLKLGKQWASNAGKQYHYFMVFKDKPIEGAYTLADFAEMLKTM